LDQDYRDQQEHQEIGAEFFEMVREEQKKNGDSPGSIKDEEEWELSQWLISNVGRCYR